MNTLFQPDVLQCGLLILFALAFGEMISRRLNSLLPALSCSILLFILFGALKIADRSILAEAGYEKLISMANMMIIVSMGLSMSLREFLAKWKVVAMAAIVYAIELLMIFLVVRSVFGMNYALCGLGGGSATAFIIQERARELGRIEMTLLPIMAMSIQGMLYGPLMMIYLEREAKRTIARMPAGWTPDSDTTEEIREEKLFRKPISAFSKYGALFALYLVVWLASRLEMVCGISKYVIALILGVVFGHIGLLDRSTLKQSEAGGFLYMLIAAMIVTSWLELNFSMFLRLIGPLALIILCNVFTFTVPSRFVAKLFGFSTDMGVASAINVIMGFPANIMFTRDASDQVSDDPNEKAWVEKELGSKMVISGMTTMTFLSTLAAGLLVGFMR